LLSDHCVANAAGFPSGFTGACGALLTENLTALFQHVYRAPTTGANAPILTDCLTEIFIHL